MSMIRLVLFLGISFFAVNELGGGDLSVGIDKLGNLVGIGSDVLGDVNFTSGVRDRLDNGLDLLDNITREIAVNESKQITDSTVTWFGQAVRTEKFPCIQDSDCYGIVGSPLSIQCDVVSGECFAIS